ncbi:MAG: hypothetical protein RL755_1652, partial [Pseudomonadota bacterium]
LLTSHRFLKRFTENRWLSAGGALLYALSPISIAATNSGRIGVLIFLTLLPIFVSELRHIVKHDANHPKLLQRIAQMFFIKWPIRDMQIFAHR